VDVRDTGIVVDGVIHLDAKRRFAVDLHALNGRRVEVIVREPVSPAQRSYYFGVLLPAAAAQMGQDRRSTHEELKQYIRDLGVLDYATGRVRDMPGDSFEGLSREDFGNVLTELRLLVQDWLGVRGV
jgi:hypothetical protein